jgi:hypothetical protein
MIYKDRIPSYFMNSLTTLSNASLDEKEYIIRLIIYIDYYNDFFLFDLGLNW